MIYNKITTGFVVQVYKDGHCIAQQFVAGDQVDYEDENEMPIITNAKEKYCPFDMVQPLIEKIESKVII